MFSTVLLAATALFQAAPASDDFSQLYDRVTGAIRSRYYARQAQKDRMESILTKSEAAARAAKSRAEFDAILDRMIAEFDDSHFDFFTEDEQGYYAMDGLISNQPKDMPNIGVWFKPAKNGYEARMVLENGPAWKAGVRKHDVIEKINGKPFTPVSSLREYVDKKAKLTINRGGKVLEVDCDVVKGSAMEMFVDASRDSVKIIEVDGKKIGYVHLWTMANDKFRNVLSSAVYGKLKDTDAFILDIRDGFGGRPEGFGDPFFRPDVVIETKFGAASQKSIFGYQRPLAVLINDGSRSAKEVFAAVMKHSKRATLIGSTTAGDVLGTSPMKIADWAYLEIPMVDMTVNGQRLEDVGVAPDIEVANEFDAEGNDLVISAAQKHLLSKIAK